MSTTATTTKATRPTTRSSLRQTLGLANMGKALADAMYPKEHREEKPKKSKEAKATKEREKEKEKDDGSVRRLQAAAVAGRVAAPRPSVGERPPGVSTLAPKEPAQEKAGTGGRRMVTRSQKLVATTSTSTESSSTSPSTSMRHAPSDVSAPSSLSPVLERARASGLRPRTAGSGTTGSSGLPKYRPRSIVADPTHKASPARPSVRRRLSTSDDSILDSSDGDSASPDDNRGSRPISPLPKRAALKVNLNTNNLTPATPPDSLRVKNATQVPRSQSPTRPPSKLSRKNTTPSTSAASGATIIRPPSAASVSAVRTSQAGPSSTPKSVRSVFGFGKGTPASTSKPAESISATSIRPPKRPESPPRPPQAQSITPTRRPPRSAKPATSTPLSESGSTPTATPFRADPSNDSFDVNMMLTMASPAAPTPAMMPRIVVGSDSRLADPETPTRKASVSGQSRHLLMTPDGPSHLRPQNNLTPMRDRTSMTLEQLSLHSSQTLAPGEDHMLSEIAAPFASRSVSGALSPTFDRLDLVPESPAMGGFAMLSPSQSLSQVILPEMTPSPAPRRDLYDAAVAELPPPPSAEAVMLRLQVAQAENVARERLATVQSLEYELAGAHEVLQRERSQMGQQVARLEEQLRTSLHVREQTHSEQASRVSALEAELASTKVSYKRDVDAAAVSARKEVHHAAAQSLQRERTRLHVANCADATAARWAMVKDVAEAELELVESNKETLGVFLSMLDGMLAQLRGTAA